MLGEDALEVPCETCGAAVGERCRVRSAASPGAWAALTTFHEARVTAVLMRDRMRADAVAADALPVTDAAWDEAVERTGLV